ncbi:TetR/AcrR family transcriptional regulator [Gordonia sp. NB41Y]|uniref:TetR/AcrR family transcriptional regulator n=1 Tax=Gordonia sp. NB41Y TaxID=875808 RepID=UPI0021C7446A|nr:TetR/AcrR family transcriptional regulator [Gordonia sp. NB41Y]WLP90287.1 TetR/AcrR family transcriptional regulator [Gordonia sp. NB41Y]
MTARNDLSTSGGRPRRSRSTAVRRRPADRRQQILDAAARAFSEGGYHAVRLDQIADDAGISAAALYRHFPNKYALFCETTSGLAERLAVAIAGVESDQPDPRTELSELLATIATTAIDNRRTGGLYRWESQYLDRSDAEPVRSVVITQHRRMRTQLIRIRPELSRADADLITSAMTSVVASPATHRASLPIRDAQTLLRDVAAGLVDVELPVPRPEPPAPTGLAPSAKREIILAASISLFAARGFHDVTIEEIGAASGVPASGVYRHFSGKAAILEAAFWRASDRTTACITDALAVSSTPREAIVELVRRYVEVWCGNRDLIMVYASEIGHLEPDRRTALRRQQRINVEEWTTWVVRSRPELGAARARYLVHAALAAISDLVRLDRSSEPARIGPLAQRILLGA